MESMMRCLAGLLLAAVCCSLSLADKTTVAHLHGLVVIKPNAHRQGLPAVFLHENPDGFEVEIPTTVHVHRFYFSGHRQFQGPIIQGGPTTIVANHPQTGNRMYVETVLPPGAPEILYTDHCITYVYPQQRIVIGFNRHDQAVTIKRRKGRGIWRKTKEKGEQALEKIQTHVASSASVQAIGDLANEGSRFAVGVRESLDAVIANAVAGVRSVSDAIPGVTAIRSQAEERAQGDYEKIIDRASREKDNAALEFVPTNR